MQLSAVTQVTTIPGFTAEVIRQPMNLIGESLHSTLLIDYHLEIVTSCTGENPLYGAASQATFIISQFTDECAIGLKMTDSDDCLVIVLEVYQAIKAMRIVEGVNGTKKCVFFILSVTDNRDCSTTSFVWTLRQQIPQ
jgi:hypothetical protein